MRICRLDVYISGCCVSARIWVIYECVHMIWVCVCLTRTSLTRRLHHFSLSLSLWAGLRWKWLRCTGREKLQREPTELQPFSFIHSLIHSLTHTGTQSHAQEHMPCRQSHHLASGGTFPLLAVSGQCASVLPSLPSRGPSECARHEGQGCKFLWKSS